MYDEKLGFNFDQYCHDASDCYVVLGEHYLDVIDPGEKRIAIIDVHQVPGDSFTDFVIIELEGSSTYVDNSIADQLSLNLYYKTRRELYIC